MKPFIYKTALNFTTALLALATPFVNAQNIQFEINGVDSDKGKLYVQLFKGKDNYDAGKPESSLIVKAKPGTNTITFNNVDSGEYAVRFFHDENDNGELEFNLFGMPVEGYGYSNDAQPNFGPAKYKHMKFMVTDTTQTVINKSNVIY